MTNSPLSGEQTTITHGPYSATIAAVGAALRVLTHDGRDLVVPFEADEIRPVFRGAILVPWPNRVVDGTYTFDGVDYQLPLTEPARGHALHGFLAWARYTAIDRSESSVTLTADVVANDGYPWPLTIEVTYALGDDGLTTTVAATNTGSSDAPYGTAPHPYLRAGEGHVDDWTLELPASQVVTVTEERLLPVAVEPVDGPGAGSPLGVFDFRASRVIGETFIDHAFTGLTRDDSGVARVVLRAPGDGGVGVGSGVGSGVSMTWGAELPWVQVHTADRPEAALNRVGLAVEPMTCPPDAFSTGDDVVRLAPGATHRAAWTIAAL